MTQPSVLDATSPRRGRPRSTSCRELELIALRLFTEQGFENTTIDQIAAAAGVSERTFFRYFGSKASVLWTEFETEVEAIRVALGSVSDEVPMMDAIRHAVVSANHYRAEDVPELRMRMNLIATVPALSSSAAEHYEAWERAVSEFAGRRLGQPPESLYPLAVGRAALAVCRAAYDRWAARADNDLTVYLDAALTALSAGFALEKVDRRTLASDLERSSGHAQPVYRFDAFLAAGDLREVRNGGAVLVQAGDGMHDFLLIRVPSGSRRIRAAETQPQAITPRTVGPTDARDAKRPGGYSSRKSHPHQEYAGRNSRRPSCASQRVLVRA